MDHTFRAVDVQAARASLGTRADSNPPVIRPLPLAELPVIENLRASENESDQAVLSWRWDVDSLGGASRNVAAALAYTARSPPGRIVGFAERP